MSSYKPVLKLAFVSSFLLSLTNTFAMNSDHGRHSLFSQGRVSIGPVIQMPSPSLTTTLSQKNIGFDWVWIDTEHGPIGVTEMHKMISATRGTGVLPIVRIPANQDWMVKSALDAGARGIMFPFINTKEEAEKAIASLRYPPEGVRGFAPMVAAQEWGMSVSEYTRVANEEVIGILQIESATAVKNIDDILSVSGVDMILIGPYDLSGTIGLLGEVNHPKVEALIEQVIVSAKKRNVPLGTVAFNEQDMKKRIEQGFQFVGVAVDSLLISESASTVVKQFRTLQGKTKALSEK
ncbi:HpcH/HpaI aldolase family protein [Endozoicomonas arenosclerae]|uniref:HpcH/HpaI aldolase family protein n=1 Tax=Endozoicomonas arenosclerae TaxID=1633495 RepID=UPI0007853EDA|nr:aldolase/citrate lyase family protein [Endozoicomonas arenosclerae]